MKFSTKTITLFVALAGALAFTAPSSKAQVSALTFTTPGTAVNVSNLTVGYDFTVSAPTLVSGLSFFDFGADGLALSHEVGLWDQVGLLLGQATVTNASPLLDSFRYTTLGTSILLLPGQTYTVGGTMGSGTDGFVDQVSGLTTAPGITFSHAVLANGAVLAKPTVDQSSLNPGLFGGSLVVVPEPSSVTLIALPLHAGLLLVRFRNRTRRTS